MSMDLVMEEFSMHQNHTHLLQEKMTMESPINQLRLLLPDNVHFWLLVGTKKVVLESSNQKLAPDERTMDENNFNR